MIPTFNMKQEILEGIWKEREKLLDEILDNWDKLIWLDDLLKDLRDKGVITQ